MRSPPVMIISIVRAELCRTFVDVEIRVVSSRVWSVNAGCARLLNAAWLQT